MTAIRNADLIDKMNSSDKDFRFMAVNDLMENIKSKSITLDDATEQQVVKNLFKMLNDPNAEVQNLVVRCLGLCFSNVGNGRLKLMVDQLCSDMNNTNENIRDAASMTLQYAFKDFNSTKGVQFIRLVQITMPHLITILESSKDHNVTDRVLDVVALIFSTSGNNTDWAYNNLSKVLFNHAESDRVGIRKRAQQALSGYAEVVDSDTYGEVLETVFKSCQKYLNDNGRLKTYISTATAICKNSGSRFSNNLPKFAQLLIDICHRNTDDEVREAALGAFEVFFQRCPQAVDEYTKSVTEIAINLLSYDPNYSYDDSDNEDAMDVDGETGTGSDDDDMSDYSDDEDVTWKVRRGAAKCIEAIITYRNDRLHESYVTFGPLLIKRLKEREDNVKHDILNAYMALLEQARVLLPESVMPFTLRGDFNYEQDNFSCEKFLKFINDDPERKQVFTDLHEQIPSLVRRLSIIQKTKNMKIIVQTFTLLGNLLRAYPGSIGSCLPNISRGIKYSLNDRDGNLKTSTLRFLSLFFATHCYEDYAQHLSLVLDEIFRLANDCFSKVASEATEVINFLTRSLGMADNPDPNVVYQVYQLFLQKLQVADMDQEVKDKTILGTGFLISGFGDKIESLNSTLILLCERLDNEMSRQATLKCLTIIAKSKKNYSMKCIVSDAVNHFGSFLRKTNRSLKIYTLNLAYSLAIRDNDGGLTNNNLNDMVSEMPNLINDCDLQIAQLALRLMTSLVSQYSDNLGDINATVNAGIKLSKSSLVQSGPQKSLLEFFAAFVRSPIGGDYEALVKEFLSIVTEDSNLHRNAYVTISKCIAAISLAKGNIPQTIQLTRELQKCVTNGQNDSIKSLGVLSLGELGRIFPAVFMDNSSIDPATVAISCFKSQCEDLKMMTSHALGALAVGNIQRFLPFILNQIEEQPMRQYLFIYALKELITSETVDEDGQQLFTEKIDSIWDVLIRHAGSQEESTRVIVAECLGKLSIMNPEKYLPALVECFQSKESRVRSTSLIGIRYMIHDQPIPADDDILPVLPFFLQNGIKDDDIETRRLAIVLLNTVAHHKPRLIRDLLESLLGDIYRETIPRTELQHEVEMGPFKHLVDDGLELRKSAFECLYSLVEHCLERLQLSEFISRVENGLNDHHDIKQLAYLTIIRLTEICPLQLAPHADRIAETMKIHLMMKPKQNAVKLENDKQEEIKRSVIKTLLAIMNMQVHERLPRIKEVYDIVCNDYSTLLCEVRAELSAR